MEEEAGAERVPNMVDDITRLLVSQAQHISADICEFDAQLQHAQLLYDSAKKTKQDLIEREGKDWTFVTLAGQLFFVLVCRQKYIQRYLCMNTCAQRLRNTFTYLVHAQG